MTERFNNLAPAMVDQIMVANSQWPSFLAEHPDAINTTIGVLIDPESNWLWQPDSVKKAREQSLQDVLNAGAFGYQSQVGHTAFLSAAGRQVFGQETYLQKVDGILAYQTLGGTGALSLSKDILSRLLSREASGQIPLVLDAGWSNHSAIFSDEFTVKQYQHIDPATGLYNHQAALEAFSEAPDNAVFLFQTSGYNDDGMDRTPKQWDDVLEIAVAKRAVVLLDSAYMGLVTGYESERYPIEESLKRGLLTFVAFSTSKNMGLYNERLGALFIANASSNLGQEQAPRLSQLADRIVRRTASSLPLVSAKAAALALGQEGYKKELEQARMRLMINRMIFAEILENVLPTVGEGRGLFVRMLSDGFGIEQRRALAEQGIFVLPNSRINLGGIHQDQVERVGYAVMSALEI